MIIVAHPLILTLSPEAEERGFFLLPLTLGEGWGEGAFPRIDAQSCYDVWCVPSFETLSDARRTGLGTSHEFSRHMGSGKNFSHRA